MSRRHRANINVEGLESKVVLSGIAPTIALHHQALVAEVTHLDGSLNGTYVTLPGTPVAPTPPIAPTPPTAPTPPAISLDTPVAPTPTTIQLHGGGMVSPLGGVSAEGTMTAQGGQLTLRCPNKNATETVILSAPHVVKTGLNVVETFSYTTKDGQYEGTVTIDFHSLSSTASVPSQLGTFDAKFS